MGKLNEKQVFNAFVSADNETINILFALLSLNAEKQKEVLKGIDTKTINPAELKTILKSKLSI